MTRNAGKCHGKHRAGCPLIHVSVDVPWEASCRLPLDTRECRRWRCGCGVSAVKGRSKDGQRTVKGRSNGWRRGSWVWTVMGCITRRRSLGLTVEMHVTTATVGSTRWCVIIYQPAPHVTYQSTQSMVRPGRTLTLRRAAFSIPKP